MSELRVIAIAMSAIALIMGFIMSGRMFERESENGWIINFILGIINLMFFALNIAGWKI